MIFVSNVGSLGISLSQPETTNFRINRGLDISECAPLSLTRLSAMIYLLSVSCMVFLSYWQEDIKISFLIFILYLHPTKEFEFESNKKIIPVKAAGGISFGFKCRRVGE